MADVVAELEASNTAAGEESTPLKALLPQQSFYASPPPPTSSADSFHVAAKPQHTYRFRGSPTTLSLYVGDITKFNGDAIVNSTNETCTQQAAADGLNGLNESGVEGAINKAAGPGLRRACLKLPPLEMSNVNRLKPGCAVVTPGFELPLRGGDPAAGGKGGFVIHTVGPVYEEAKRKRCEPRLRAAYSSAAMLAREKGLAEIAFPAISCGAYAYPIEASAHVAFQALGDVARAPGSEAKIVGVHFLLYDDATLADFVSAANAEVAAANGSLRAINTPVVDDELSANPAPDFLAGKAGGFAALVEQLAANAAGTEKVTLGAAIGDDGARALATALAKNTTCISLDLRGGDIGDIGAELISDALRHNKASRLSELFLWYNHVGPVGSRFLAKLISESTVLRNLDLQENSVGAGVEELAAALVTNTTLEKLGLGSNGIGDEGADFLALALKKNKGLLTLGINNDFITPDGASALAEALGPHATLEILGINENSIGPEGARVLMAAAARTPSLTTIYFRANNLGVDGASHIAKYLVGNTTLIQLGLEANKLSDSGAIIIAQAVAQNKHLEALSLTKNHIGNAGATALISMLDQNTSLKYMGFDGNTIADLTLKDRIKKKMEARGRKDTRSSAPRKSWACSLHGDSPEHDTFLSYRCKVDGRKEASSPSASGAVEKIYKALEGRLVGGRKLKCFWDKACLAVGDNWFQALMEGLAGSTVAILFVSAGALEGIKQAANRQDNMLAEFEVALERADKGLGKVFPIFLEGTTAATKIDYGLENYPDKPHYETGRNIRATVKSLLLTHGVQVSTNLRDDEVEKIAAAVLAMLPTGDDAERLARNQACQRAFAAVHVQDLKETRLKSILKIVAANDIVGRGVSSIVYSGTFEDMRVAVKKMVTMSGVAIDVTIRLFQNEYNLLSELSHPNIMAPFYHAMPGDGDEVFLVLPLADAGTLSAPTPEARALLKSGRVRLQVAAGIADGLAYLHSQRIVHRDVKPENVLLSLRPDPSGKGGMILHPHIADLGISKRHIEEEGQTAMPGTVNMGTPGYVAPEAVEGRISFKSDVYSLGVVLLGLMLGRSAIICRGKKGSFVEKLVDTARADKRPVSKQAEIEVLWESIDALEGLQRLAFKCTSVERANRPTMSDCHFALVDLMLPTGGPSHFFSRPDDLLSSTGSPDDPLLCCKCEDAGVDTILQPCGHAHMCQECAEISLTSTRRSGYGQSFACPSCNLEVTSLKPVPGLITKAWQAQAQVQARERKPASARIAPAVDGKPPLGDVATASCGWW